MKKFLLAAVLVGLTFALNAFAAPDEYVYPARVEAGEREIDIKFGSRNMNDASKNRSSGSIGLGYGVNEHWFTEVYLKFNQNSGSSTEFDAIEWENRFQFTETGKHPVDVGFLFELERPQDRSEGYEVKLGPLFQADIGKTEWIANFLFKNSYQAEQASTATAYYQLQGRYLLSKQFSPGFQAFGDLGKWNDWSPVRNQGHRIGPAIFGKIPLDERRWVKYNAAFLLGKTQISQHGALVGYVGNTFRLQLEYPF